MNGTEISTVHFKSQLSLSHACKALAAVHGTVRLRLEGNLCIAAAGCAHCGEVLTGATSCVLAVVAAVLAALGLILEASLCVKLLLTGSEHKFLAAFLTY
jgi:hypothetical protein